MNNVSQGVRRARINELCVPMRHVVGTCIPVLRWSIQNPNFARCRGSLIFNIRLPVLWFLNKILRVQEYLTGEKYIRERGAEYGWTGPTTKES
jgi:hypothetical protein